MAKKRTKKQSKNMTKKQRGRVEVKPGITGLAQAKGRNGLTIKQKINYDLEMTAKNIIFVTVAKT